MSSLASKIAGVDTCLPSCSTSHWYAAYTYPRHERSVEKNLAALGVDVFCPTFSVENSWKDRRVTIHCPLFPGYVFTRIHLSERIKVISHPSVLRLLSFNGVPVPIPDCEIDAIRLCVVARCKLESHPFVETGMRARVRDGLFSGVEGIVIRKNNKLGLVVSISAIHQSVVLDIDPGSLQPLRQEEILPSILPGVR
jgi:transcription antitermination factor NusG